MLIDGTLVPTQRRTGAANRPNYSGKLHRHGLPFLALTDERGRLIWISAARPGRAHDAAARRDKIVEHLKAAGLGASADLGFIGVDKPDNLDDLVVVTGYKATRVGKDAPVQEQVNRILAAGRAPVEHGFANLKAWRVLTKLRTEPRSALVSSPDLPSPSSAFARRYQSRRDSELMPSSPGDGGYRLARGVHECDRVPLELLGVPLRVLTSHWVLLPMEPQDPSLQVSTIKGKLQLSTIKGKLQPLADHGCGTVVPPPAPRAARWRIVASLRRRSRATSLGRGRRLRVLGLRGGVPVRRPREVESVRPVRGFRIRRPGRWRRGRTRRGGRPTRSRYPLHARGEARPVVTDSTSVRGRSSHDRPVRDLTKPSGGAMPPSGKGASPGCDRLARPLHPGPRTSALTGD
ncbi:transposase family protein [Actinacidiphila glaucinigra]|uniref:transposase family protein n=1 Tax=Actinacidiphila glaucinigra TaxID=235986 RepID=UPI0036A7CD35